MRILLTNNTLDTRAGSELYVRDVALALLRRGHQPIACSRRLGDVANELRNATIPVIDDPAALSTPPDVIHAQHHLEAMTALACHANVPAIYVCHGWLPAEEAPPEHPRILRYLAVDDLVASRLSDECGLPPHRIETLLNFVDTKRFTRRPPLPVRPKRALVFSNQISELNGLPELRRACEANGIELETCGRLLGTATKSPEELLGGFDIVFAKARAALEAMAVGCAVVLCDARGLGPLVTTAQLDELRRFNFGVRLLLDPITVERLAQRIADYDNEDARSVTLRIRNEANLESTVDRLETLYAEVLTECSRVRSEPAHEHRALARYLRHGPLTGGDHFQLERSEFQVALARADDWSTSLTQQLECAARERKALEEQLSEKDLLSTELRERLETSIADLAQATASAEGLREQLEESDGRGRVASETLSRREQDLQMARRELARTKAALEEGRALQEALKTDLQRAREQLGAVQATRTWRLRERLIQRPWLARIYRSLAKLR